MSGFVITSCISARRGVQNPTRQVGRRGSGGREGRKEGVQVGRKSKKDEEEEEE